MLISTFTEFQHIFGGLWQPSPLGYAVEQFFDNGGREALIVRVVNGARSATLTLRAGTGELRLRAVRPGTREFLRAGVDYDNIPESESAEFNLVVQRVRVQGTGQVEDQEIFRRLSLNPAAAAFVPRVLADSALVRLAGDIPAQRPDRTVDAASGLATGYVNSNTDGDDGAPLTDYDLIGRSGDRTGLFALESADYFNFLCIPPLSREQDVGPIALLVGARFCKDHRALLIVDPPSRWLTADDALQGMRNWNLASENARDVLPARAGARQAAGPFRIVRALRRRGGHVGALRRSVAAVDAGQERRGRAASRVSAELPGERGSPHAAGGLGGQHPPSRAFGAHRLQCAYPGRGRRRQRRLAVFGDAPAGTIHRQQHRARHALDRDGAAECSGGRTGDGAGACLPRGAA
jgi:hypothetical protein